MEIKSNDATLNRPKGDRIIDAPLVIMDLNSAIQQLTEENAWKKYDRNGITLFKTPGLAVVLSALHAGAEIIENYVDGFLSTQVISGKVKIQMPNREVELNANQVMVLHPQIAHTIIAQEDAIILLTHYSV